MSRHIVAIPSWYKSARGSGGGYFRDQALALQEAGYRVAMLAPDIFTLRDLCHGRAPSQSSRLRIEDDGIPTWRRAMLVLAPRLPYRNAAAMAWCGLKLFARYCRENGAPDLVQAHSALNAGVVALAIKHRYGIPYILSEHSTAFAQSFMRRWEHMLTRRVVRGAALCTTPSPHLAELLSGLYPGSHWQCLPNLLGEVFAAEAAPRVRDEPQPFVFLSVARQTPEKGHALLIEAFADAFRGDGTTRLRLVGDGPLRETLQTLCHTLEIDEQVDFPGTLSAQQVRDAMCHADAVVLASEVETFGVVVIEALACGCPVIVTASGGPDHIVDASNGLLIPTGDRPALRGALIKMRWSSGDYDSSAIRAATIAAYGPAAFTRRFGELIA